MGRPDPDCEICHGSGKYRIHEYDLDFWQSDSPPPLQDCDCVTDEETAS